MNRLTMVLSLAALLGGAGLRAQNPLSADVKAAWEPVRSNILKAAEKMPEADYGFKPTPDVRTFGQLIAHVADAQLGMCSIAKGAPKRGDAASKTSKADLIAALNASSDFCEGVYGGITDAEGSIMVSVPGREKPRLGLLNMNVAHDNEMYGTIAVYLRLKGIVPPSTEGAQAAARKP